MLLNFFFFFQGWYVVTYALGIYHLNLFIAFLTPKIDPAMDFDGKYVLLHTCRIPRGFICKFL